MRSPLAAACETPRKLLGWLAVFALTLWIAGVPAVVSAQPEPGHEPAAATASHTEQPHEESVGKTIARLVNFAILVGALVYLLRSPLASYLANRGSQIRGDLVNAAEMKQAAAAQIAEIDRKMKALPGELEALRAQGVAGDRRGRRADSSGGGRRTRSPARAGAPRDRLAGQGRRARTRQPRRRSRRWRSDRADQARPSPTRIAAPRRSLRGSAGIGWRAMTNKTAALRYARALLDVAVKERAPLDTIGDELAAFVDLFKQNPSLEKVMLQSGRAGAAQARRDGRPDRTGAAVADSVEAAGAARRARPARAPAGPSRRLSRARCSITSRSCARR